MKSYIRIPLYLAVFVCLAFAAAYVTFFALTSTRSHEVPVLVGRSLLEANKALSDKKLFLKMDGEEYDADTPAGYILKQNIPAGNRIKEGRTIGVIISKGPKILYVPVLSGLTLDEAEALARQNNIRVEHVIKVHSDTVERNRVIAQDPNPEEHGAGGITLVVSTGYFEDDISLPAFISMRVDAAKALAQKFMLEVVTSGEGGKVVSQSPPPGTIVRKGGAVRLELKEEAEQKWWF